MPIGSILGSIGGFLGSNSGTIAKLASAAGSIGGLFGGGSGSGSQAGFLNAPNFSNQFTAQMFGVPVRSSSQGLKFSTGIRDALQQFTGHGLHDPADPRQAQRAVDLKVEAIPLFNPFTSSLINQFAARPVPFTNTGLGALGLIGAQNLPEPVRRLQELAGGQGLYRNRNVPSNPDPNLIPALFREPFDAALEQSGQVLNAGTQTLIDFLTGGGIDKDAIIGEGNLFLDRAFDDIDERFNRSRFGSGSQSLAARTSEDFTTRIMAELARLTQQGRQAGLAGIPALQSAQFARAALPAAFTTDLLTLDAGARGQIESVRPGGRLLDVLTSGQSPASSVPITRGVNPQSSTGEIISALGDAAPAIVEILGDIFGGGGRGGDPNNPQGR